MKKKILSILLCLMMVLVVFAGCSGGAADADKGSAGSGSDVASSSGSASASDTSSNAAGGEKFKIGLSNSYMGNDWRQIMIKTAEVVATKDPYAAEVDFSVVNTENTPEAQIQAIDAMIEQGYDAILIDASSSEALVPVVERALEKGIVIVSFDSVITHDDVYIAEVNLKDMATAWANFLVSKCGKGAKIAVDTGLPGMTNGTTVYDTAMEIFKANDIEVVAEFAGEWADGKGQQEIGSVLAANPKLDGLFSQVYGDTVYNSFKQAGRELIPCTAYDTNGGLLAALDNDMEIIIGNNCPGLSAVALDIAYRVLKGETVDQVTSFTPDLFVNDDSIDVGYTTTKIEEDVNVFRDFPSAFDWPVVPSVFSVQVTPEEVQNYAQ